MPVLYILQKAAAHRRRHRVSNPLRDVAAVTLERHADHLAVLHDRAAAVSRIDLRADLNRKVRVDRRMRVKLEVDARDDAGGNRHALTADWITVGRDRRFKFRNSAEFQRSHVLEKIRRRYGDERQIAIVRHVLHRRPVFVRIAIALHREVAAIADHVRIGHDPRSINDKSRAHTALNRAGIPRRFVIRLGFRDRNPHETILNFAGRWWWYSPPAY